MFGTDDPTQVGYFSADSEYGKAVLRQAQRTDTHVYRILSGRIVLDASQLKEFVAQDDRLTGQTQQRVDQRWRLGSNEMMNVFQLLPDAADESDTVDKVAEELVRMDKQ